jgi:hypothetical protein
MGGTTITARFITTAASGPAAGDMARSAVAAAADSTGAAAGVDMEAAGAVIDEMQISCVVHERASVKQSSWGLCL